MQNEKELFITIDRHTIEGNVTCGKVLINGEVFGSSLERQYKGLTSDMDVDYIVKHNLDSPSAIPTGRYKVAMDIYSTDFGNEKAWRELSGGYMPQIIGVPGYKNVYLCSYSDSSILRDFIVIDSLYKVSSESYSEKFKEFFKILKQAHRDGKQIWIHIK